ncbi:MAG TPA: aspartate aminotransferase family protein [Candidatus Limnocylindrales bacterium]|nr:aspartate aminotransferase family protein [Candidatus Limnocylindrales bacterium]
MPLRGVSASVLAGLMEREQRAFVQAHPRCAELAAEARHALLGGVPMNWMNKWPGAFPVFASDASGAHFSCADGTDFVDLCLGDTGAMTGHSPAATVNAIRDRSARGMTLMLPTDDAIWVGRELARRFGLPYWQFALTATDANRFAIRLARMVTGRPRILVFNYCYHGTVDETFISIRPDGSAGPRDGSIGPPVDPAVTTRVVEFNDVPALEAALAEGDVAAVLAEPAMTNIGIIHPEPGYHDALRELTRRHGSLLILDETHTICAGPGGYTAAEGLSPDMLVIGKPIAGGLPAAAYGLSTEVAGRIRIELEHCDVGGIGGTLAGNALSMAAMRATLSEVLTEAAFSRMISLAEAWTAGVEAAISETGLPWHVTRLGCRAEYLFSKRRPRNGSEAAAMDDFETQRFTHLYALNRGILLTPFHNMALTSPDTTAADVDHHTAVFSEMARELCP